MGESNSAMLLFTEDQKETLKSLWPCNAQKHMEFVYKETVDSSAPTPTQNSMNSLHAYAYLCLSVMRIRLRRSQGSRLRQTSTATTRTERTANAQKRTENNT
uniref:Uncharacterized protein n=1 Tax=Glossina pallidipes TaxID=7398 RepID=A0A1A9ZIP5_GLOPL